jgi:trans-aconitate 2-methyltransferase
MPWNPEVYDQFKEERTAPFFDLMKLVDVKPDLNAIDLGCGTGELTGTLAEHLPNSTMLGIDTSTEMLAKAEKYRNDHLHFECVSIESVLRSGQKFDLIFSNAALQWVENHEEIFPQLFSMLNEEGQLAIQMPSNHDHITHLTVQVLARREPFRSALKQWLRTSPVLKIEQYAEMLYEHGARSINVFEKVYPHVLKNAEAMADWTRGTLLVPYMEKLSPDLQKQFLSEYVGILQKKISQSPVFYSFKRIFISALM